MKKRRAVTYITIAQSIFLTIKYFVQNRLFSYASACSFDFLFSFIPIAMMIVTILVRILHASPDTVYSIFNKFPELSNYINPEAIINSIQNFKIINSFEVILALFVIWMARRFFASIFTSIQNIFFEQQKNRPIINQILTVVLELIVVFSATLIVFVFISINTISTLPILTNFTLNSFFIKEITSGKLFTYLPNILIFVTITLLYKGSTGTKPTLLLCLSSGFLCTLSFWFFRTILHAFINIGRYNLIYGVLGRVIILFMDIYFFFIFFLFFAQFIFIYQFFDELLIGELYLLPKKEEVNIKSILKRALFIKPDFLLAKDLNVIKIKSGQYIYKKDDTDNSVYYISKGILGISKETNKIFTVLRGDFFGEVDCILEKNRDSDAIAFTDCEIVKINKDTFLFLIQKNPEAAIKALYHIKSYFSKIYGLTE